jgi:hypothetical protein
LVDEFKGKVGFFLISGRPSDYGFNWKNNLPITILLLDTGRLFQETYIL